MPQYSREMKTYWHKETYTRMFTAALILIAKQWKQPKGLSAEEWINYGVFI